MVRVTRSRSEAPGDVPHKIGGTVLTLIQFLFGIVLVTTGSVLLVSTISLAPTRTELMAYPIAVIAVLFGANLFFRVWGRMQGHLEVTRAETRKETLGDLNEKDFDQYEKIKKLREEKARVDFARNLQETFVAKELRLRACNFFGDCSWPLQPGVNVLLGRNGYGKSLLLRCVASLLQRDTEISAELLSGGAEGALLQLEISRNSEPALIERSESGFDQSVGKIPILAIPDSRFVNRSDQSIAPVEDEHADIRTHGAYHFLYQKPYENIIQGLLYELCLDYIEHHRSFDVPAFRLLRDVVETLTEDAFSFHAIERSGRNSYRIEVITEGNDQPLPIQYASQGTLSVLAVFGLIRSYLKAVFPKAHEEELLEQPAIVFMDELDAHLHPKWHQKLVGLLRKHFPNIQFIVSAHSPLMVAGCLLGEVSVLRKTDSGNFVLQQPERDFIGATAQELYEQVFDIEDADETYLEYKTKSALRDRNSRRIDKLERKEKLMEDERRELTKLHRENNIILRTLEVSKARTDEQERILELEAQVDMLENKLSTMQGGDCARSET